MIVKLLTNLQFSSRFSHREHHVSVSVRGPQVQGRVVPHVGCVHARAPPYQHLQDLQVTPLGRPVQRRELVVIPEENIIKKYFFRKCFGCKNRKLILLSLKKGRPILMFK